MNPTAILPFLIVFGAACGYLAGRIANRYGVVAGVFGTFAVAVLVTFVAVIGDISQYVIKESLLKHEINIGRLIEYFVAYQAIALVAAMLPSTIAYWIKTEPEVCNSLSPENPSNY
jgi:hypothetical protein